MLTKAVLILAAAASALARPIPSHGEGFFTMHAAGSDSADQYCLAIDGEPGDGSEVLLRKCDGSQQQGWSVSQNMRGLQAYETWKFQFGQSRFCMTGTDANTLGLTYCMDSDKMRFNSEHGTWQMKNSELCIDVADGNLQDGAKVILGACAQDTASQLWDLQPAEQSQMHPFD